MIDVFRGVSSTESNGVPTGDAVSILRPAPTPIREMIGIGFADGARRKPFDPGLLDRDAYALGYDNGERWATRLRTVP